MQKILLIVSIFSLFLISCQEDVYEYRVPPAQPADISINAAHPMRDSLQKMVDKYIAKGLPGLQIMVKNQDGWYMASGGYARIEDQTPFHMNTVSWYFSPTKMYTAALIMRLKEMRKIDLDEPITNYLPDLVSEKINRSNEISVRMLMNHTSGIINVTELPAFQLGQLNRPLEQPGIQERLKMVAGKPLLFEPGTDFSYSNTNFLLLYLLVEELSEMPYGDFLQQEIILPLQLKQTYFALTEQQLRELSFPNYYFDRFANEQLENISTWNAALGNSSLGYGGIAGTAPDAIRFMEALVEGEIIGEASLAEMKTWVRGKTSEQPDYGLGMEYYAWQDDQLQYGHEGDGIGCTTLLMYVPANDTYLYINTNVGRQLFGPYLFKTTDMKIEACRYVSAWRK